MSFYLGAEYGRRAEVPERSSAVLLPASPEHVDAMVAARDEVQAGRLARLRGPGEQGPGAFGVRIGDDDVIAARDDPAL